MNLHRGFVIPYPALCAGFTFRPGNGEARCLHNERFMLYSLKRKGDLPVKWEYDFYQAEYLTSWDADQRLEKNLHKQNREGMTPAEIIDDYGRRGWEIVAVTSINGGTGGYTEALLFTFKRPLNG